MFCAFLEGMNRSIQLLDVVALLRDRRDFELIAGQVGTVVDVLASGVFEVEFSDDEGRTYAMVALKESELIALHYNPRSSMGSNVENKYFSPQRG